MCGILGVVNLDGAPVDEALLVRMRDTMWHRGPDDAGVYVEGPVGLAMRRLSILDLSSAGHQPMTNEGRTLWLVFNGEIYNYVELAAELKRRGHRFRSTSDSEVLLHLFQEEGERCLQRLNGMFAFAIWDRRTQTLFAARDRIGIKPFSYYCDARRFIFASEAKAILEDPTVPRRPDYQGLAGYLFAGMALGGRTAFADIQELPPGHCLTVTGGRMRIRPYWDLTYDYQTGRRDEDLVDALSHLLDDSVRVHCRSDAPVGCHLSGGLDSSTVVTLAARHRQPLEAFSIKFDRGGYYDETSYAKLVAGEAGAAYREVTATANDLATQLPRLVWHMDAPMATNGGFAYHLVSKLAAQHVKVSLTGHGGDEVFAGYPAQFQATFKTTDMFASSGNGSASGASAARRYGLVRALWRAARRVALGAPSLERDWIRLHCNLTPRRNPLLHPDFVGALAGYAPEHDYLAPLRQVETASVLDRCLYHDLRVYLPALLHMEDRVSMAVSLESRVPLLDHRIVEFMATIPPDQKVKDRVPKYLLRRCAARVLPERVWQRKDKSPFPVPAGPWFADELTGIVQDLLFSQTALGRGIFAPAALRRALANPADVWAALNVELWFRIFIDKDAEWLRLARASQSGRPASLPDQVIAKS